MSDNMQELAERLAAPFEPQAVEWKPQAFSGDKSRALAAAYVDARTVQDRLDEVFGVAGWQDEYETIADGNVVCRLRVLVDGQWICKSDVGGQSDQPSDGDKCKAAFSDSLKRAAVKLGIGRYLYRLPTQWAAWDQQKRTWVKEPTLPAWALPKRSAPDRAPTPAAPVKVEAPVSKAQAKELCDLISANEVTPAAFYAEFKVGKVSELPAALFGDAKAWLAKRQAG